MDGCADFLNCLLAEQEERGIQNGKVIRDIYSKEARVKKKRGDPSTGCWEMPDERERQEKIQ